MVPDIYFALESYWKSWILKVKEKRSNCVFFGCAPKTGCLCRPFATFEVAVFTQILRVQFFGPKKIDVFSPRSSSCLAVRPHGRAMPKSYRKSGRSLRRCPCIFRCTRYHCNFGWRVGDLGWITNGEWDVFVWGCFLESWVKNMNALYTDRYILYKYINISLDSFLWLMV